MNEAPGGHSAEECLSFGNRRLHQLERLSTPLKLMPTTIAKLLTRWRWGSKGSRYLWGTGFAIVDGGSKSFALDGPAPHVLRGGTSVGRIEWCGDEFGRVLPQEGQSPLPIGAVVECTVPHCDPTINLHDFLHVAGGDRITDIWRVEGRGRSE